jgi:glycosyltransferase involved in cell wall biosynthesis
LVARGADRGRVAVIPNAARPEAYVLDPARRAELRRDLGIGGGQVAVGFVGRFGFWRGMGPLMEAIGRAAAATTRAHFVLVGDGQLMPEVRRFVAEHGLGSRVTLTGSVAPAAVPSHVAALDVGVLAGSPWYSSPIKLFEYGAAGLGIVAPRVTPVEEVLQDGVEGLLVPAEQPEAIAHAILALAQDDARRRQLGDRFRARVLGAYTWSHVAAGIEALMAGSPRRRAASAPRPPASASRRAASG